MLDHGAAGHLADPLVFQIEFVHQRLEGGGQHVLVVVLLVGGIGAREGDARPAEDGYAFHGGRVKPEVTWRGGISVY